MLHMLGSPLLGLVLLHDVCSVLGLLHRRSDRALGRCGPQVDGGLGGDIGGLGRLDCLAGSRKLHRKMQKSAKRFAARKQSADPRATAG